MILLKNAYLLGMADVNYETKDLLLEGKTVKAIGTFDPADYPGARVIDAANRFVTPGIIDAHCHVGISEEGIGNEGTDYNEVDNPVHPELRAIDAIKPQDEGFREALKAGITTVSTGPGSANVIGGTFCVLKTRGTVVDQMIVKAESAMKMALGENPKRVYGGKNQTPYTRMASAALIREALIKAREYRKKQMEYKADKAAGKETPAPETNVKWASLSRVFDGLPVKIHAHQQDDIATAIRIVKEFGLSATIDHATEGHLMTGYLKDSGLKVILGPTLGSKTKYELRNKTFESGRILHEAGIEFAIMTDHPVILLANALTQVGLFVREGLPELEAFRAVTINPARMLGLADRLGTLEAGKDADLVVWSGHPFHYLTKADLVMIEGEVVHERNAK